uniref:Direct IAP-binding protein with low pI n=1 Tax=Eptatretus burgeri TaxID=7764 RepID=A0A8C4NGK8_EPTBU
MLSLGGSVSLCAFQELNTPDLSQTTLIKRAASLAIDSASTLLTQAGLALIDAQQDYAKAISVLVSLYKRYTELSGHLSAAEDEAVRRLISAESFVRFFFLSRSFPTGAEQASLLARTHLDAVHSHVESSIRKVTEAHSRLTKAQATEIKHVDVSAGRPVQTLLEEEQLPEQYLRED